MRAEFLLLAGSAATGVGMAGFVLGILASPLLLPSLIVLIAGLATCAAGGVLAVVPRP